MATKTKKPKKAAKAKVDKLSTEELENVQQLHAKIQQVVMQLGSAELARQSMVAEHSKLSVEWTTMTQELEEKYGQVNVNLADGSLSEIEAPTAK